MNKKTVITTIFIFLMSCSIFSLVDTSSKLANETTERDEPKNTLRSSAASHLFDGMYIQHTFTDWNGYSYTTTFIYGTSGGIWYESWDGLGPNTWVVDNLTRIMSGGSIFMDGAHTPAWIFTDIGLGDTIPIAVNGEGDHSFLVSGESTYNLPGYGWVDMWELSDLDLPGGWAWYEKSTGILLYGYFPYDGGSLVYSFDFLNTNVVFVDQSMRIGFIRTHQEREMPDLKLFYENLGYSVDEIESTITESLLSNYRIIFVSECWVATVWSPGEITTLENWMQNGGVLIGIGDEHLVEFEQLAATYGIEFLGYYVGSSGTTSVIDSSHPLMSGVTSLFLNSVFNALDVSTPASPIIWDSTGAGIYGAAVHVGLGRFCVLADDFWLNIYDDDNEILFENILSWYAEPSILTILFDEAHLPVYSIGSNPASSDVGGYSEFAGTLTAAGYTVNTIDPGTIIDAAVLSGGDILVMACSQNAYTTAELNAIETWVRGGGSLLLITDWGDFGAHVELLATRFGFDFKNDCIEDSDDGVGTGIPAQLFYDGPNILSHPITTGVSRVEMYAGDGFITVPVDEIPIIKTDTDGTATWFYDGTPALGVSVMSVVDDGSAGAGKVVVIGDTGLWVSSKDTDSDGDLNFYDSDNEILAMNTINWLAPPPSVSITILFDEAHIPAYSIGSNPAYSVVGGYSEFAGLLTTAGYTVDTIDPGTVIDATVLSGGDILVIVCSQSSYTTAELDAIEMWVGAGGSLLLISDWDDFGTYVDSLAVRFGFDFKNDAILDSDDGVGTGDPSQLFYDGPNILSHPITTGVSRVEMYAGDGLSAAPVDEIPIIITDTDGTATWYYAGTPALGVSIMSVVDDGSIGAGKVCVIGDTNIWDSAWDFDDDGEIDFYDSDNEILALNTINWLAPALVDSLNVTSPDSSSSWETGTTHSITWTSEGSIPDVKIELFKDGVFVLEINASTANDGEFSWTIPSGLDDSTQYQINISDVSNPDTYDLSDNFEIFTTPEITVTSPDSSSSWETETTHSITWTSEGSITDVKIELFKDGVFVLEIIASTANNGDFSWAIPSGLDDSTQYQINISDVSNPDTYDLSDNFEIFTPAEVDSLTITTPNSSSSWETGTTHSITWTSTGTISDVKIELFESGVLVLEIVASTANDGEFSWSIPSGLDNSTQYQIKITDATNPAIEDISDNFEIFTTPEVDSLTVTNPSSLTAWEMGTSHTITWTSTGSITNVKIELFKDGVLVLLITASTANDGSYTWDIPTDLEDGIDYQIKISDVSNPATYDESPDFVITSIDIPEDGGIPSYNLYILIGIICIVSVILVKNRKNIKPK